MCVMLFDSNTEVVLTQSPLTLSLLMGTDVVLWLYLYICVCATVIAGAQICNTLTEIFCRSH